MPRHRTVLRNGFSRTASLKQPGSENNFSENNFSQTARTNCEDEPRITSLRTPSPSSLRARTCTSQKGFSTQIVRRKGSVARHRHPAAIGFGLPSTNQAQDDYTRNIAGHAVAMCIDPDRGVAGSPDKPPQTTQFTCTVDVTHTGRTHLSQKREISKNVFSREYVGMGRCGGSE